MIALAGDGVFGTNTSKPFTPSRTSKLWLWPAARDLAEKWHIQHWTMELDEVLDRPEMEAVILATPTPIHAAQAERCIRGLAG